jgi:mitogen-activated protein kinase 15
MDIRIKIDLDPELLSRYDVIDKLGKGGSGILYKGVDKYSNAHVAIKKTYDYLICNTESEKLFREIRFLEHFRSHPNIILLQNVIVATNNNDVYLIFELMETNLFNVIRAKLLTDQHIKYISYQLLKAVKYIHSANVIHRDLKPGHILINSDSKVKINDFSLAIIDSDSEDYKMTDYASTRWYRAPEILLNAYEYNKSVDMWSIGCILGEMINGRTLFPGNSTINQIGLILELTGKPNDQDIGK